jgi:hypothetical protein
MSSEALPYNRTIYISILCTVSMQILWTIRVVTNINHDGQSSRGV